VIPEAADGYEQGVERREAETVMRTRLLGPFAHGEFRFLCVYAS
jgi:hypothetical protein